MNAVSQTIKEKFEALKPLLDERGRRRWAATEARAIGRGGIERVFQATGIARSTVRAGLQELGATQSQGPPAGRQRRAGGGRKRLSEQDPDLRTALEQLVEPLSRGDPTSPLRWTCKSAAKLAAQLQAQGHPVSERTVNRMLHELGYRLQTNRKTLEGRQHPDRDAQFAHINERCQAFQDQGQPVISVDTKKKEVKVYDFPDKGLGKAIPYGVYDLVANEGWVSVGVDPDTAAFAVETIRRWWRQMGWRVYGGAQRLLITAAGDGSNASRNRLWKLELQRLADELGLAISVCHFPPGTSKWNKIEHRMFCHITENWRGRPLVSREAVVNLIGNATTKGGLEIQAELDEGSYPTGREVTEDQMARIAIERDKFHGEWNYTVSPRR